METERKGEHLIRDSSFLIYVFKDRGVSCASMRVFCSFSILGSLRGPLWKDLAHVCALVCKEMKFFTLLPLENYRAIPRGFSFDCNVERYLLRRNFNGKLGIDRAAD